MQRILQNCLHINLTYLGFEVLLKDVGNSNPTVFIYFNQETFSYDAWYVAKYLSKHNMQQLVFKII